MIKMCGCGGLYGTENFDSFAGTPCECSNPKDVIIAIGSDEYMLQHGYRPVKKEEREKYSRFFTDQ